MRLIRGKGTFRTFRGLSKFIRDFTGHGHRREFQGDAQSIRHFAKVHSNISTSNAWLWGDTDKILSQILGTFGDQL